MSLSDRQAIFTANVAKLISWINSQPGHRCRIREATRPLSMQLLNVHGFTVNSHNENIYLEPSPIISKTMKSKHLESLAVDLIIDINGVYQDDYKSYIEAGKFWESLHPENVSGAVSWGWDGQHFQMGK